VTGILRVGIPMESTWLRQAHPVDTDRSGCCHRFDGKVVGWVLARNLARPIRVLTQATGQMEQVI
jgi:hypothetical protein